MTIALGFHTTDGVILCADTQITIGEMKTYDGKVDLHIFPQSGVIVSVAGAGHDDYIQTAKSYLLDGFSKRRTMPVLERDLRDRLLTFFSTHIAPWANFSSMDCPAVELLIGITGAGFHPKLFHYDGTAFSDVRVKAIGLGVLLAQDLLDRYSQATVLTANQAATLGLYIISKVKQGVEKCGGSTHILGLRKEMDFALTDSANLEATEKQLLEIEKQQNKKFLEEIRSRPISLSWQSEYQKKRKT